MAVTLQGAQMLQTLERSLRKYLPDLKGDLRKCEGQQGESGSEKESNIYASLFVCAHTCGMCEFVWYD